MNKPGPAGHKAEWPVTSKHTGRREAGGRGRCTAKPLDTATGSRSQASRSLPRGRAICAHRLARQRSWPRYPEQPEGGGSPRVCQAAGGDASCQPRHSPAREHHAAGAGRVQCGRSLRTHSAISLERRILNSKTCFSQVNFTVTDCYLNKKETPGSRCWLSGSAWALILAQVPATPLGSSPDAHLRSGSNGCHPCGRLRLSSLLLALAQPVRGGCRHLGSESAGGRSLSVWLFTFQSEKGEKCTE